MNPSKIAKKSTASVPAVAVDNGAGVSNDLLLALQVASTKSIERLAQILDEKAGVRANSFEAESTNVFEFIEAFEDEADLHDWDDDTRRRVLIQQIDARTRRRLRKISPFTYEEAKEVMYRAWGRGKSPGEYWSDKLYDLEQGTKQVVQYAESFERTVEQLGRHAPLEAPSVAASIALFKKGLKPQIKRHFSKEGKIYATLDEACRAAERFARFEYAGRSRSQEDKGKPKKEEQKGPFVPKVSAENAEAGCQHCGRKGHSPNACRVKGATCHRCHTVGHIARVCPQKVEVGQTNQARKMSEEDQRYELQQRMKLSMEQKVLLGSRQVVALLDTGATHTLVSERVVSGTTWKQWTSDDMEITGFNGAIESVKRKVILPIRVPGGDHRVLKFPAYVIPGLNREMLLGQDFLLAAGASIRLDLMELEMKYFGLKRFMGVPREQEPEVHSAVRPMDIKELPEVVVSESENELPELVESETGEEMVRRFIKNSCANLIDESFGKAKCEPVRVELKAEGPPIASRPFRASLEERRVIEEEVDKMLKLGVIRRDTSAWSAPLLVVPKPNNRGKRPVIDFRKLNQRVAMPAYPSPIIRDLLAQVDGSRWFSTIDVRWGYWNLPVHVEDQPLLSFVTHSGQYVFERLPMGLVSSPAIFQSFMDKMLEHIPEAQAYQDDILVQTGGTLEEHVAVVESVLVAMSEENLRLQLEKCTFGKSRVEYLGHVIGRDGIEAQKSKLAAVRQFPVPTTAKAVRSLLGFCGYYRQYVPDFSTIANPLNKLLRKGEPFVWADEQKEAFEKLKKSLTEAPVLAHFNEQCQHKLQTDASDVGLGAVLTQVEPSGEERPLFFASRTLRGAELRYPVREKEALAIVFGIQHFREFLHGRRFTVETDHQSLRHLWTQPIKMNSRLARWMAVLQEYDFQVVYRAGEANQNADVLSRYPLEETERSKLEQDVLEVEREEQRTNVMEVFEASDELPNEEYAKALKNDSLFGPIAAFLRDGAVPDDEKAETAVKEEAGRFLWKDHVLQRDMDGSRVVVVPKAMREQVLKAHHGDPWAGHFGRDRVWRNLTKRFWWPNVKADVIEFIKNCEICQKHGAQPRVSNQSPRQLWEPEVETGLWCIDLLGPLPLTRKKKNRWILVMIQPFTRWTELVAMPDATAETVAEAFFDRVIARHGVPTQVLSDQGKQFEGHLFKELCRRYGIRKLRTSAYHPQTNGAVERHNQVIIKHLKSLCLEDQSDWDEWLSSCEMAYRTSVVESVGYSPFQLRTGQEPVLPMDVILDTVPEMSLTMKKDVRQFIESKQSRLREAFERVGHLNGQAKIKEQREFNQSRQEVTFSEGELVLVWTPRCAVGLAKKLAPLWRGPYLVKERKSPVTYRVGNEDAKDMIVHVNRMKRFNSKHLEGIVLDKVDELNDDRDAGMFAVQKIVDKRIIRGVPYYRVRWQGYGPRDDTFEPVENLEFVMDEVEAYERRVGDKPKRKPGLRRKSARADCGSCGVEYADFYRSSTGCIDPETKIRHHGGGRARS